MLIFNYVPILRPSFVPILLKKIGVLVIPVFAKAGQKAKKKYKS